MKLWDVGTYSEWKAVTRKILKLHISMKERIYIFTI